MPFESVIGQEQPKQILRRMLHTGIVPHAFIFYGIPGVGKKKTAYSFTKALNCELLTEDFCDQCSSCQKIERDTHPDVLFISPNDDKKVVSIGQLREMQRKITFQPIEGRWKVVIIEQADSLQNEAANNLLKTLEEPPEKTILILIATSIAGMLPTILSRCQQIQFFPLTVDEIAIYLQQHHNTPPDAALYAAMRSQGSIERAIMILEEGMQTICRNIEKLLSCTISHKVRFSLEIAQNIAQNPDYCRYTLDFLELWYRDMLLLKTGIMSEVFFYNRDSIEMLPRAAHYETKRSIINKIKRIRDARNNLTTNQDIQLLLESILLTSGDG